LKKFLLISFVLLCALCGHSEPMTGDEILAFVRTKLPKDPIRLTGILKVKAKNGYTRVTMPAAMQLDWGAAPPTASYRIGSESLTIRWDDGHPDYTFSNPENRPTDKIIDSGISWADLSFSVFWWPDAQLIDEGKKINRDCYIIDVPIPGSNQTMRLWIEKNMGMLLEAQTLDAKKREINRLKILSIKKLEGMWVAKDLEIREKKTGTKTTLEISDLEWVNGPPQSSEETETATAFDPAESVNALAADLYQELAAENEGNLFFSPYSISSALAMTYGGARSGTAAQMNHALHFGGQSITHPAFSYLNKKLNSIQEKGYVQLSVANSLWPDKNYAFLPDYLAMTKEFYGAELEAVDFKTDAENARLKINQWVESKTSERIKELIPEGAVDAMTRLVLANAIYFKGDWAAPFNQEATRPAPFKLDDGTTVDVPMMAQTSTFNMAFSETFQALELPYAGDDLSMILLLPNDGEPLSWVAVDALKFHQTEVRVHLPKFKIESAFGLSQALTEMGMPLAFDMKQADFSGMDGSKQLYISAALHKAFVEVNEQGTEAAAATGIAMGIKSMPIQFTANRPFLFLIRENSTGTILFIGRVMDPST
jgi:serpin B